MLPVPTARHTPKSPATRAEIEKRSLNLLQPGSTTREDMLWEFGAPDLVSSDERYFVYRWLTIGGYLAAVGYAAADVTNMGARRHDMAFEFDEDGVLVRFGNIETLITEPIDDNTPIDATPPMELSVLYRRSGSEDWSEATLRVEDDRLTLRDTTESRNLATAAITHFEHKGDDRSLWLSGWLTYQLHYRDDDDNPATIRLQINALDVLRLAKFLQSRNPAARITD